MFLSTQLTLHYVKSQTNRVAGRKGQVENNPHPREAVPQEVLES